MRIDGEQEDIVFEPLSSFLFKCTFTAPDRYKKLLTDSILEKLKYSVVSLNIPKLTEKNLDAISYGSFSLPFPYYSTGQKEMSIDFFETDDMLISRVFYVLQSKKRWSAKTIFRMSDAELFLHVEIYPQRNAKGYKYPMKNPVFVRDYGLIMKGINPPEFSRTGEVTLLKTKIEFNTIESNYYGEKGRTYQDSGIDPTKEKNEWDKQAPEAAFIDTEQIGDRIAEWFGQQNAKKMAEINGPRDIKKGSGVTELDEKKYVVKKVGSRKYMVKVEDTKELDVNGNKAKAYFVDPDETDPNSGKKKITSLVLHTRGAMNTDIGTSVKNLNVDGVGAVADQYGNVMISTDAASMSTKGIGSKKAGGKYYTNSNDTYFSMEMVGQVAYFKSGDQYFARSAEAKNAEYKEISKAEFDQFAGVKYDEKSMEGNSGLNSAKDYELGTTKKVQMRDGTYKEVQFDSMYDSALSDLDLETAYRAGRAMKESGRFDVDVDNLSAISHGMALDHEAGKSEMLPKRTRQILEAFKQGWKQEEYDRQKAIDTK